MSSDNIWVDLVDQVAATASDSEKVVNKANDLSSDDATHYPTTHAVVAGLAAVSAAAGLLFSAENKQGSDFVAGNVVATHSSGTGFVLASATDNTKKAVGLAAEAIISTHSGNAQLGGIFELSDWTAIIGATTLAAKTVYYLSTVAGKLTATAPSTPGQVLQVIGTSISTTQLNIEIEEPILL